MLKKGQDPYKALPDYQTTPLEVSIFFSANKSFQQKIGPYTAIFWHHRITRLTHFGYYRTQWFSCKTNVK